MYDCWKLYPNSRPSFTNLTERISDLLQTDSKSVSKSYFIFYFSPK